MTTAEPQPTTPAGGIATPERGALDEHGDYVFESGIVEGHAHVPMWLTAVFLSLLAFFVIYIVLHFSAQPNTAQSKSSPPAPASPTAPATPSAPSPAPAPVPGPAPTIPGPGGGG